MRGYIGDRIPAPAYERILGDRIPGPAQERILWDRIPGYLHMRGY